MPRKNGECVSCRHQHEATERIHPHNLLFISSVPPTRQSPVRFSTSDCGLKRPFLRLLGVRPFGTRTGWDGWWYRLVGAVRDSVASYRRQRNGAAPLMVSVMTNYVFPQMPCAAKSDTSPLQTSSCFYFKKANTISGVKSTLMMVQRPCPMSLTDAPSNHTSSSIIR